MLKNYRLHSQQAFLWIHEKMRVCLHCGAYECNSSQFCRICESRLWQAHSNNHFFQTGKLELPGTSVFEWHPDQDRRVSKLMMTLKGGRLASAYDYYAEKLIRRSKPINLQDSILVPCPSKKGRRHSQALADSFSRLLGLPVCDILRPTSETSQKERLKSDRQKLSFTLSASVPQKHVIFIDDIVTTGATADAAASVLMCRSGFEVWCLAQRRQLATGLGL